MADTTDAVLIDQYRDMMLAGRYFKGLTVVGYAAEIEKLVRATDSHYLIDYGSGYGEAWRELKLHQQWGVQRVECYDPAVHRFEVKPVGEFDGVLCVDVLEHLREHHVRNVVTELFAYATKFIWASVCCRAAKKTFPDGKTNLHVTVQPYAWWAAHFEACAKAKPGVRWVLLETP